MVSVLIGILFKVFYYLEKYISYINSQNVIILMY